MMTDDQKAETSLTGLLARAGCRKRGDGVERLPIRHGLVELADRLCVPARSAAELRRRAACCLLRLITCKTSRS